MKKRKEYPFPLIRRLILLLLTGFICIGIGLSGYLAAGDRILLCLSIAVCVYSFAKTILLWWVIKGNRYEEIKGICVGVSSRPFRRYKNIKLIDVNGNENGLLIPKQARIRIGYCYRFIFRKVVNDFVQNEYLSTMLAEDNFLGFEELGEYMEPAEASQNTTC